MFDVFFFAFAKDGHRLHFTDHSRILDQKLGAGLNRLRLPGLVTFWNCPALEVPHKPKWKGIPIHQPGTLEPDRCSSGWEGK